MVVELEQGKWVAGRGTRWAVQGRTDGQVMSHWRGLKLGTCWVLGERRSQGATG